ncbi:MAG: hypothetical protein CMP60_03145 [Flavobacteriales bacterium]|nr:hypothetical protein [Flavobacteriales bacterium]MDG1718228.1 hypothetical protein [Flavobacteriales bacterium]|tara:strand:+ start:1467 stop:1835 length:369 start_codon:yes stop_codon:yes gene_type:complete
MKKLLLILLCAPLIFSCGENNEKKNNKEIKSNSIKSCLVGYDWCIPSCNNPTTAWKFSTGGTFNYSTTMFGGMSASGTWEEYGNQDIKIVYTRTSTGDLLPEKTIIMPDCKSLKIGQTIYRR